MLRSICWAAALPLLTLTVMAAPAPQDDQGKGRAILEKAIKALGGEERIGGLTLFTMKSRTKTTVSTAAVTETTEEISMQFPSRARIVTERNVRGNKSVTTRVMDGESGWQIVAGRALNLPRTSLQQMRESLLAELSVRELLGLLKDNNCKLVPLGETRVDEKPAVGLKVSRMGVPDLKLYFETKSGLLLKRETVNRLGGTPRPGIPGREYTTMMLFEDYQDTAGVKLPFKTSTFRDGRKISETELLEFKAVDKFDDKTFTKP